MRKLLPFLFLLLVIFYYFLHQRIGSEAEQLLAQANQAAALGEKAQTIQERQKAWDQALDAYLALQARFDPTDGNGQLYLNIGTAYFHLDAYPWSLLYGLQAASLRPRDPNAQALFAASRTQLNLPPLSPPIQFLSVPERLQLFSSLWVSGAIFLSLWIWQQRRYLLSLGLFFTLLSLLLLGSATVAAWPTQAVLVEATPLRRSAGENFALVQETPLPAGSLLRILNTELEWAQVETEQHTSGWIKQDTFRPFTFGRGRNAG